MSAGDLERATKDLAEQCLAKFDDTAASLDVRSFSLSILVSQISNGNSEMVAYVPEICQRLEEEVGRSRLCRYRFDTIFLNMLRQSGITSLIAHRLSSWNQSKKRAIHIFFNVIRDMFYSNVLFVAELEALETRRNNSSKLSFSGICEPNFCLYHHSYPTCARYLCYH